MSSPQQYYWNIDRIMRLILGVVIAAGVLWLIYYLRDALLPFFAACVVAYLLQPLVTLNQRWMRTKGRVLPSFITVFEVTVIIAALLWLTIPTVLDELNEMGRILSDISAGRIKLSETEHSIVTFFNRYVDPNYLTSMLSNLRVEELLKSGSSILEESKEVILRTLSWLLMLIYVLFILIDYPQIVRGFKMIVPEKYRSQAMTVVNDIKDGMNHYFRGQGKVALCAMVLYCIGFLIVGLPLAIPMGLLVGILYMIPYFQYITAIPVLAICIVYSLGGSFEFWPEAGKCALVYLVSQCLCDYVITPHVMGKELGLNPAVILLSLSVWGSLLGIIGMVIALPATAFIMQYYKTYISNRK